MFVTRLLNEILLSFGSIHSFQIVIVFCNGNDLYSLNFKRVHCILTIVVTFHSEKIRLDDGFCYEKKENLQFASMSLAKKIQQ